MSDFDIKKLPEGFLDNPLAVTESDLKGLPDEIAAQIKLKKEPRKRPVHRRIMYFTPEEFEVSLNVARQAGREKAIATLILARPEWEDEIKRIVG